MDFKHQAMHYRCSSRFDKIWSLVNSTKVDDYERKSKKQDITLQWFVFYEEYFRLLAINAKGVSLRNNRSTKANGSVKWAILEKTTLHQPTGTSSS